MGVGLVVVSHSERLAAGVAELAAQMAPDVVVLPAGGLAGGALGTDFDKVSAALSDADSGSGVVLLYDLGSAQMTAELAVETLGDPTRAIVADAPLVEGAVAAAVEAQGGKDLDAVARAAVAAGVGSDIEQAAPAGETITEELELRNEVGLHARPAALLARSLAGLQADVRVRLGDAEADAASVLGLMGLGARKGDRVTLVASGADAGEAVRRVLELVEGNFGE
ncbi:MULTISPECIES: dihydroxyacetone kinase phosphoryl donor subunit DhaM [Saccharopolyspora]|uniref:Phosphocarrier protein HPr n=1 Tax=Saccharopolyspora gregorii TaxID=33914 RepID=A0ABP6RNE3_9PSEU|nr:MULTISPECIES: dihydroxyacetone kinase phosphoryl donor subunit DhaM [Saccharopolyspora]MCA1186807.1 PTS-dependent dihydroxyacetone kinase phosphotransferase subunit DhaM [Saccharopolyspora sp. 6T]MCA1190896.1 PTS-dependent dihydroxyacetone kinase phosphotransferase subunit DhaM [Saccharopolyspora sp. 6V]MCA1225550.1 PTS-dependent dihydroxyacetone kinase phosphotransferase subunit DhaM [Saccharopolyspora sp. 6M]MCA1278778.1 PTS-dependent dihydroxyacetone kinase phosphotransferase subunit DhaM